MICRLWNRLSRALPQLTMELHGQATSHLEDFCVYFEWISVVRHKFGALRLAFVLYGEGTVSCSFSNQDAMLCISL